MEMNSMSMSAAPKERKSKAKASVEMGGKKRLNDNVSTKLYQLSKNK